MTMAGFSAQSTAMRRLGNTVQANSRDRPPGRAAARAGRARRCAKAGSPRRSSQMEQAVALSPRDVGYRLLLADIYLKSGRFESARATFGDVLDARSGQRPRRPQFRADPDRARPPAGRRPPARRAGEQRPAVRHRPRLCARRPHRPGDRNSRRCRAPPTATPRIRQNLALAYAMPATGAAPARSRRRTCPPAELGPRLQQWAAFARPDSGPTQVAGLLGVSPAEDPGQPVRARARAGRGATIAVAFAEAAAPAVSQASFAPAAPAPAPAPEPVQVAEAAPAERRAVWAPTAADLRPARGRRARRDRRSRARSRASRRAGRRPGRAAAALADVAVVVERGARGARAAAGAGPGQLRRRRAARSMQPQAPLIRAAAGALRTPPPRLPPRACRRRRSRRPAGRRPARRVQQRRQCRARLGRRRARLWSRRLSAADHHLRHQWPHAAPRLRLGLRLDRRRAAPVRLDQGPRRRLLRAGASRRRLDPLGRALRRPAPAQRLSYKLRTLGSPLEGGWQAKASRPF